VLAGGAPVRPRIAAGPGDTRGFLEAINDPEHEEHDAMLEWVGGQFDPEAFDPAEFEHRLNPRRLEAV
jgi:hypothetical protein